jgi:lysophospholipase L1-like esterase
MRHFLKQIIFRVLTFTLVLCAFEIIGYIGMWITSRSFDYLSNKNYFNIRAMLTGHTGPEMSPAYLSQPYLGYIPYPGYKRKGVLQHNQDGYRGQRVSFQKTDKYRILCMGGSTTYGFGVDSPSQAYPAQLEKILNEYVMKDSALLKKYKGVEVINGGLEDGNSAEELQQYLFKYRYYKPDVVIVHSGVNDALLLCQSISSDYQLDYTHYRRMNFNLEALGQPARFLMRSYFISFIVIRLFYNDFATPSKNDFQRNSHQAFCKWSKIDVDSITNMNTGYDCYPFYRNSKSLYSEIINDSSALILLPNAVNGNVRYKKYSDLCLLNSDITHELAKKFGAVYIRFNFNSIDSMFWIDDCHLNKDGERKKAKIIVPYILKMMQKHRATRIKN